MKFQLLRHATTILEFAGKKIMVDPVLSPAGTRNPIPTNGSGKGKNNPLVELPIRKEELDKLLQTLDAVLITHTHSDHFDDFKGEFLPKSLQIFCQPEDAEKLIKIGFVNIKPIEGTIKWENIKIIRAKCHHGGIYWRWKMGKGSGYVFKAESEPNLYITGDTIWCGYVKETIQRHHPGVIIIYGGAAQFPFGRSITMNKKDIRKVCNISTESQKIIVHMEAINHCRLKRNELRTFLDAANLKKNIYIPNDGQMIDLGS